MDITLRPELEQFIAEKVQSGQFGTPSDIVNVALEVYRAQEQADAEKHEALRRDIQHAIDQMDRGEGTEWDPEEIRAEGRRLFALRNGKA